MTKSMRFMVHSNLPESDRSEEFPVPVADVEQGSNPVVLDRAMVPLHLIEPGPISELLDEIELDRTAIFWGGGCSHPLNPKRHQFAKKRGARPLFFVVPTGLPI